MTALVPLLVGTTVLLFCRFHGYRQGFGKLILLCLLPKREMNENRSLV
ncbi:unnamed protein product [Tenebrio molitor]|nr:unnamed protein product [Tenebrio molitor]